MTEQSRARRVLALNTLAFTVCFAVWMMNGVLVTWLVENRVVALDKAEMGWLIGLPVLTGALLRLPVGMLSDRYGGRIVFAAVMLAAAPAAWFMSVATTFGELLVGSLGFGLAGASFAVGIAYTSVWFPRERQGTALGIFGVGNAGAAITSMGAPFLLRWLTDAGANPDRWRWMPRIYAVALVVMAAIFWMFTYDKLDPQAVSKSFRARLAPLKSVRVWRFGLYYFLVFGGFVALAQWLIPYYVNVYATTVATAGLMAAIFSLPSGLIRALGGWLSDRFGARTVMYWVLGGCTLCCAMLVAPRMDLYATGEGVMAASAGVVERVEPEGIVVSGKPYALTTHAEPQRSDERALILPTGSFWHEAVVQPGDSVQKKQLLARGVTHLYFQANMWVFTAIAFVVGILMGIGKAAVYKHIPEYFPHDVGVVGGIVGVLGGLGGFLCPVFFGGMLRASGIWTTCWIFLAVLAAVCLVWMHIVVRRMMGQRAPHLVDHIEHQSERATQAARAAQGA